MKGKQALNVFMPRWIQTYKKQNTKNKKTKKQKTFYRKPEKIGKAKS
jgi:hypothetical protein